MDAQDETEDNLGEKQRIVSSSSAFTPVKPFAEYSPPFSHPQEVDPTPFLPTSSPPGWYSSLISSLWRQEHNNNLKENSDEIEAKKNSDKIYDKGDSDEKQDKKNSDEIHEKEQTEIGEKQTGLSNTGRIIL